MNIDESVKMMRGKPKTSLTLTIIRQGEPKPLEIEIERDIIKIQSVYAKTIEDKLLYVHVTSFDQKVVDGVKDALKEHSKAEGLILDLRNNPGGLLDQAVGLVDLFVDEGVIVSVSNQRVRGSEHPSVASLAGGGAGVESEFFRCGRQIILCYYYLR